jgi:glycosyltransferase involved in cell wall biosynthesis
MITAASHRGVPVVSGAGDPGAAAEVSVIMIFLDAERFIEEAIASVFAQTYPHWELLLVDDGSRDGSTAIARGYAARHPERVRYLEHPGHVNRGTGPSRDLGLANAKGVYVTFLDADDVYLPERLARHVAVLEASPEVDVVQSRHLVWFSWDDQERPIDADHLSVSIEIFNEVIEPPIYLFPMLASEALMQPAWSLTLRRATAVEVGGFGDEFRGSLEDLVFATKLYLSKRVIILNESHTKYRRRRNSLTRRARERGEHMEGTDCPVRWGYLFWLERYLKEQGITDPTIWQALREELPNRRDRMHAYLVHVRTLVQSRVRRFLAVVLPRAAYFGLMRWRREREVRRAALRLAWARTEMARSVQQP